MVPLMSKGVVATLAVILALPFVLTLIASGGDAEGLMCAAMFSGLVFGFIAIIYGFRVAKRRMGFMLTLLAVHENGLLIRTEGKTVLAPWHNIEKLSHVTVVYKGVPLPRHNVHFRNGVTMTYGGDPWTERDCQRISEFVDRKLSAVQPIFPAG